MIDKIKITDNSYMPQIVLGSYQVRDAHVLTKMLQEGLQCGVCGFDTSPSYGNLREFGVSLQHAMSANQISRDGIFLASKIDGWQMCHTNGDVEKFAQNIMTDLQVNYLDLLLIHWPFERYLLKTWKCLETLYAKGFVKSIGLCNVNRRVYEKFVMHDISIKPHVIQNEISPLRSVPQEVAYFQSQGICLQAYSPLARMLPMIQNSDILKELSEKHQKTIAQIIMKWHVQRGIVPVFTSSKAERIVANVDIFDFMLTKEEMASIYTMNQDYKIFPESFGCPGF